MSLITVSSLSKSFGAEDLFANVSFSVAKGARLALVGPNGIGKTTLLRILIGQEEPSSGTVTRARNLRIGYLPQEADFQLEGRLWQACLEPFAELIRQQGELERLEGEMSDPIKREQALVRYGALQEDFERRGGYVYQVRIKQVLTGLGFDESEFHMSLDHLSGGQRTRAYLARLLLSNPDLLLLDEPTNHLDMAAVEWLEGYLSQWEGAAVIVSHDRYFLDHACNALLEMALSGSEYYRGNYTTYLQERENRWQHRVDVFESGREKLMKDVEYIRKNISGQNVQQAKGKLRRLTRVVQAIEQVGMDAVVSIVEAIDGNYFEGDHEVNDLDYDVWKGSFGETSAYFADGNLDGIVDAADYTVWRDNVGLSLPGSGDGASGAVGGGLSAVAAPEPSALILFIAVGGWLSLRARRLKTAVS